MSEIPDDLDKPTADPDKPTEERKRFSFTLTGTALASFSKRLEAEPELSADRLASKLLTQVLDGQPATPESPVATELKVLTAHLQGLKTACGELRGVKEDTALALGTIARQVQAVEKAVDLLGTKNPGPAELNPEQMKVITDLTGTVKQMETTLVGLTCPSRRDLRLAIVSIVLIGLAGWAAFRPAPAAKVDLTPLQVELRAIRQAVESRPDLGPKVTELTHRIDVQDKAIVAVMDKLQPHK